MPPSTILFRCVRFLDEGRGKAVPAIPGMSSRTSATFIAPTTASCVEYVILHRILGSYVGKVKEFGHSHTDFATDVTGDDTLPFAAEMCLRAGSFANPVSCGRCAAARRFATGLAIALPGNICAISTVLPVGNLSKVTLTLPRRR